MEEQSDTPRTDATQYQWTRTLDLARDLERELATATRERDEARAIANDRDAMVDHRDRALTAMYQRVDVITQERDEAIAEVERLRSALLTLANAADDVGVQFFDMEDPPISVAQMQSATLAARAAAEPNP